jgi:2-amino-4-hydroxy-6-hydroxymethyldihydropteridine diphosphokinase
VTSAYVGLGSNLDHPAEHVRAALEELKRLPDTSLAAASSLYRSRPVGYAAQPDFVNAVAALDTGLAPLELLRELQAIETRHGRVRTFRNAPRTLDLDLLLYGAAQIDEPGLTVPHPRMHERAFVLKPLLEIAPQAAIPGRGAALALLEGRPDDSVQRID